MHVSRSYPRTNAQTFTQVSGVRPWNFAQMFYGSLRKFWWTRFFYCLTLLPFFGGPTGSKSYFEVVSILGPQKTGTTMLFLNFSKTSCRRITQRTAPQNFVVKLVQLMLELSSSRRRRPKNAIFLLKSSNLRVHRGTAKFIALIGKTSRRFNELDPEILHRYSMGHNKKTYGGGFLIFFIFDLEGSEYTAFSQKDLGPRKNGEKKNKLLHTFFCNGP